MLRLRVFSLTTEYEIDRLASETSLVDPTEFGKHQKWTDEMLHLLQNLVDEQDLLWYAMAKFQLACALYSLLDDSAEDEIVPEMIYAICGWPDKETFKLDGLNLKFMGSDRTQIELRSARDCNILIPIFSREDDSQSEDK